MSGGELVRILQYRCGRYGIDAGDRFSKLAEGFTDRSVLREETWK